MPLGGSVGAALKWPDLRFYPAMVRNGIRLPADAVCLADSGIDGDFDTDLIATIG